MLMIAGTATAQQRFTNPNAIVDTFKKSIPCITKGKIHNAEIEINYYSPGVKNRTIWGGLVPYDEVWVTGAHNATSITISKPFSIGNIKVNAGKYALFTIPGKEQWIFILNKNYQQHLSDNYKQEEDILRLAVKPIWGETVTERLQYSIVDDKIVIVWEKVKIEIPINIQ
jgi:Protein of unknown function (DUF2911)